MTKVKQTDMSLSEVMPEQPAPRPIRSKSGVWYRVCWGEACFCHDNWCKGRPVRPAAEPAALTTLKLGPFKDMKELYKFTNKQTSRKLMYHFQSNVGNPDLCLTLFSGGSFYGLSTTQKKAYLRKKATDVDNDILYTDNEFAAGRSKLCFEFDLKSVEQLADWKQQFIASASYIAQKLATAKHQSVTCHLLTRPPKQCNKSGEWKYGMHVVFGDVITSVQKGHKLSAKFKHKIAYIDSCYDGDNARLRPAYGRKVERTGRKCVCNMPCDLCACLSVYLSSAYCYDRSIIATAQAAEVDVIEFKSTYQELLATTIWPL